MKRIKVRKLGIDELRETGGKIRTEELFIRDTRLALMFVKYMLKNVNYLKRYEYDKSAYDEISKELGDVRDALKRIDKNFKDFQKMETGDEE